MAVNKKDKGTTISPAYRTIIADNVHIETDYFVDEEGHIVNRVLDFLTDKKAVFKVTIKIELHDEKNESEV